MLTKPRSGVFVLDPTRLDQRGHHKAVCKTSAFDIFKREKEHIYPDLISSAVCAFGLTSVRNIIIQAVFGRTPTFSSLHGLSPLTRLWKLPLLFLDGRQSQRKVPPPAPAPGVSHSPGLSSPRKPDNSTLPFLFPNDCGWSPCWLRCWKFIHSSPNKSRDCPCEGLQRLPPECVEDVPRAPPLAPPSPVLQGLPFAGPAAL